MSIMEAQTLDMAAILMQAYDVGDLINRSQEAADYAYWKQAMEQDPEAQRFIRELAKTKELFEETQRFGHYHPNYHEALEKVRQAELRLQQIETVARFTEAEERLDNLLFSVSETIARSVSESIKVPSNKLEPEGHSCASGGSCSGNCG
ncbi:YlbF family regulator [Paenibacillus chartarius]|uniref:YlbF family regulator n=1 Tax=Paenibacillus chartarius TaxID=747481 RepID=A0ABV6DKP7_9BACL